MTPPAPILRWSLRGATFAAVALLLVLVARYWHPVYGLSSLIQLDTPNDNSKISAFRHYPVYVHRDNGGYDGLYYAQIAYDPLLGSAELPPAIDNLYYRARRILPSAVSWILAAGQPAAIIHVYSWLNVVAWLALAALLWRLLAVVDFRGWLAWAGVLFSCGALSSVRLALTDLPMALLLAAGLFAAERSRRKSAVALLAAAGLARETAMLGAAGLITRPWFSGRNLLRNLFICALVVAPLLTWLAYMRWRIGPHNAGWANLTLPFSGLVEKTLTAVVDLPLLNDSLLAWTTLLAVIGIAVQAVFFAARWRLFADAWWRVGAAYSALMLTLGTAVWEGYPGAFSRVLLPLTLAFNIFAHRTRAALAWLLLGNLGIAAGFLMLRDFPLHSREFFVGQNHRADAIGQIDTGWFGIERDQKHVWSWSSGRSQIVVETWSDEPVTAQLDVSLRALTPRTVVVRQADREIWRGPVGEKLTRNSLSFPLARGRTVLEFSTDTPGTPEGPEPKARALTFALYNPRLTLAPP